MLILNPKPRNVDYIHFDTNFLSQQEIDQIHTQANSINFQEGKAGTPESPEGKETRSSNVKWLPQSTDWAWLYNKIIEKVYLTNDKFWDFNISTMHDFIQYSEYKSSQGGHYTWHADLGPDITSYRKLAVVIPLTPTLLYEGGKLEFNSNYKLPPEEQDLVQQAGSITIFPTFILHRVSPVVKGVRNSLVAWMGGVPFR